MSTWVDRCCWQRQKGMRLNCHRFPRMLSRNVLVNLTVRQWRVVLYVGGTAKLPRHSRTATPLGPDKTCHKWLWCRICGTVLCDRRRFQHTGPTGLVGQKHTGSLSIIASSEEMEVNSASAGCWSSFVLDDDAEALERHRTLFAIKYCLSGGK